MKRRILALLAALAGAGSAAAAELTVSAAASLKDVLEELKPAFEASTRDRLVLNLASSGALQQQIENGAPVDVFVSAAAAPMDALEANGKLEPKTHVDLLKNQLVLVVPNTSKLGLTGFKDLADARVKKIAVGEAKTVPAGQYAAEVFRSLKIEASVEPRLVYGNNVRQVLTYVETGDVDAGVVYATDARSSAKVTVVATADAAWHGAIVYPLAVVAASKNKEAAKTLAAFLTGEQAAAVFKKHGFTAARDPS